MIKLKKILICLFMCALSSCCGNSDIDMEVVTMSGDTLYIKAYALTAEDGEVWFKSSLGTGYIADVEYIKPLGYEKEEK